MRRISALRFFLAISALFLLPTLALPARATSNAADAPHVRVELIAAGEEIAPFGSNEVGLYFKLEPGWHIYWKNPGDAGLPPQVRWTLPEGITAGPLDFPAPERLPLGPLMDFGYEGEVLLPVSLQVAKTTKPGPVLLHADVNWLVCKDSCIPGKAELEETLVVVKEQPMVNPAPPGDSEISFRIKDSLPKPLPPGANPVFAVTPTGFRLSVRTGQRETEATFFPVDSGILDNPAPQPMASTPNGLLLDLKKDTSLAANPPQLRGVLELSGGRAYDLTALPGKLPTAGALVFAPSPAALPAVPSATSAATSSQPAPVAEHTTAAGSFGGLTTLLRISGLAFLGGLLLNLMPCVFPVLFLKGLALVNSGSEERARLRTHGLVYAAGILVSFWALVAVLLGLRAAGSTLGWGFQFQSPVFLSLMAGLLFFLGLSLAGQFEIGLTLTSAGGSLAQKQGLTGSFFTGVLAVIVATPCTAPFMGAAVGYALSASVAVTFAVFTALGLGLAAPYVALTLQPAWTRWLPRPGAWMEVLKQAVAVPIFATVIWLAWALAGAYGAGALAALLVSFLLLAIAGWFLGRWPAKRGAAAVALLIVFGAVALDFHAARTLAAQAPPLTEQDALALKSVPAVEGTWQPWSPEAVSRAQAAGRPVFVDFTARWCLSCQVNERVALERPEVQAAFRTHHVALFKADWTRHDAAISQALAALGRSGVPAYALYVPGETSPRLLPEALTAGMVLDALQSLPQ